MYLQVALQSPFYNNSVPVCSLVDLIVQYSLLSLKNKQQNISTMYQYIAGAPAGIRKVRKCVSSNFQSVYVVKNQYRTSRPGLQSKHVLTATICG